MNKRIALLMLALVVVTAGCESMGDNTKKGAGIGALTGAAIGGIVGHQGGHGWEGALIGAGAGAVGGGLIGNSMDKKQMAVNPNHITVMQIAEMAQKGVPEDVIIGEIDRTHSKYELTSEIINYLKTNGVTDKVINYMLTTASSA